MATLTRNVAPGLWVRAPTRTRSLTDCAPWELDALLEEECSHWSEVLSWDFHDVSAAVRASLERGTLRGKLLQRDGRAVAYCYYLSDAGRTVVGSLFATRPLRDQGLEEQLLGEVLAEFGAGRGHDRVECQTLFCTTPRAERYFGEAGFVGRARHYLTCSLEHVPVAPPAAVRLRRVRREDLASVARVIHRSHVGSLDAALNLTYATAAGCRAFVDMLVLRSGCGRFLAGASQVAEDAAGRCIGVLLASRLSARNGHICQVSVLPEAQQRGTGRALVHAALKDFARRGLKMASLSVTVDNRPAYLLYKGLGFRLRRSFSAHARARLPARVELPG